MRPSLLGLPLLALSASCNGTIDGGDGGPRDGGFGDATVPGEIDARSPFAYAACLDGTHDLPCCPANLGDGDACNDASLHCRTQCTPPGNYSQLACDGHNWMAGHGLFPCTVP